MLPKDRRAILVCSCVIFGALGAEMFSISIVWHMVQVSGPSGAYYLVPQLAAATLSGLVGAGLLDRFAPLRITLCAEAVRVVASVLALYTVLAGWPARLLVPEAIVVAMVRPHHSPGVMGGLSRIGLDREALRSVS